jgi:alanyl-tRNA synthetase
VKTKKGVYLHFGSYTDDDMHLNISQLVNATVDYDMRIMASYNHSATHLLNKAVKLVLGQSVAQKGSYIDSSRIRFDFNHDSPLTNDEISKIENIVNTEISKKMDITIQETTLDEASKMGVDMLFEDRYAQNVRVVTIGDFSKELCGGTHTGNTQDFGKFKILKQESVGKGIRRIRAELQR